MDQFGSCAGMNFSVLEGRRFFHPGPLMEAGFRPFSGDIRWGGIHYLWVLADIHTLHIVTKLDRYAIGVEGINGMDETMVDHFRNPEPGRSELVI